MDRGRSPGRVGSGADLRRPQPGGTGPAGTGPAGTGPAGTGPAGTGPAGTTADDGPARLVDDDAGLAEVVSALAEAEVYAVDTEFHRERTYWPQLALVQIAWASNTVLVDPLAVDIGPLRTVLEGSGLAVMHAASQDLEVLNRACGAIPSRLFDTQLAAGFLGFSTPSLSLLASRVLDVDLPKASRLTDWMRRPLAREQLRYAAADVDHLRELAELLRAELAAAGRLTWAEAECEELRVKRWGPPAPEDAWLRLKESRSMRGRARGIVYRLAAWRERRAAAVDQPVRFVLSDLALVGIAGDAPKDLDALRRIRGIDQRHLRGGLGPEILAEIETGRSMAESALQLPRRDDLDRDLRPALALLVAWVSQLSRELAIDPALLATRNDLTAFLNGDPDARLADGWRAELVGRLARRLVDGELALAFDGKGGLTLERRSGELIGPDLPRPRAPWVGEG